MKEVRPVETNSIVYWEIITVNLETKKEQSNKYDAVMVCNGHYSDPFIPNVKGKEKFHGKQWHSHDYREPSCFTGKKVLLVGAGSSGMDIAAQVTTVANKVFTLVLLLK